MQENESPRPLGELISIEVSVSLCTYMRPTLLKNCLEHLLLQETDFPFEIIVVDNDSERSALDVIESLRPLALSKRIPLYYLVEPLQNIARARNRAVAACAGKFIAFIDDDEYPEKNWLNDLHKSILAYDAIGVFGPVVSEFPSDFPRWLLESGIFDRQRMKTGDILSPGNMRTGNAMIDSSILHTIPGPFDERLGRTGGEDSYLFDQLHARGHSFYWCDEAVVHEIQEIQRANLSSLLARSYRGGWCFSRNVCARKGFISAALVVSSVALLGLLRNSWRALFFMHSPKTAATIFLQGLAGQFGKFGYFLGLSVEVYKKRPSP